MLDVIIPPGVVKLERSLNSIFVLFVVKFCQSPRPDTRFVLRHCLTKVRQAVARSFLEPVFLQKILALPIAVKTLFEFLPVDVSWQCKTASVHGPLLIDSPHPLLSQSGLDRTPIETLGRFATLNRLVFPFECGQRSIRFVLA